MAMILKVRKCLKGTVALSALVFAVCAHANIQLRIDAGALPGARIWPLGTGVPFKEGQVRDLSKLGIKSASKGLVPACFEARTRYPDGSVQWAWTDFQAALDQSYTVLTNGQTAPLPSGVKVIETSTQIVVNTGVAQSTWSKSLGTPTKVAVKNTAGSMVEVGSGDGQGVYLIDNKNQRATLGGSNAGLQWKVETSNKLRAVIRLEGWYTTNTGTQLARCIVRYHLYWNRSWMNMDHTFIVTRDNDRTWYKEIGITFPLKSNNQGTARIGIHLSRPAVASLKSGTEEAWVFQEKYPHHYMLESKYTAGHGSSVLGTGPIAPGWMDVENGLGDLIMAVRDFAPQFPKELSAKWDGLTARLWSNRGGRILDYKPSTLSKDDWGDAWVDRLTVPQPGKEGAPFTPEKARRMNPSAVGVGRTHEILVGYYAGAYDQAGTQLWAEAFQTPPIAYPDPLWTCHVDTRVMWPMAARGEGGAEYEDVERYISVWLDEATAPFWDEKGVPNNIWPFAGWIEWGCTPLLCYEKDANGKLWARWYRVGMSPAYEDNLHIWLAWARSGDRKYLNYGRRLNRFLADNRAVHWGGGKQNNQKGSVRRRLFAYLLVRKRGVQSTR